MNKPSKKTTIIVIDDDHGITEMVEELLSLSGYKVIILDGVQDAGAIVKLIEQNSPSVVILDLWMPGISGEDLARYLKSNEKTASTPIIVSSARKDTADIARDIGSDAFIVKPFNIDDFESTIAKYAAD